MADGTKSYIEDEDGNKILPATDWSIIQNKPTNLATTDQLPKLSPWQRDGLVYKNGAYDWDHVNNGYNCAYRVADMGSFKLVELRLVFAVNQDITNEVEAIELPRAIQADGDEEVWEATGIRGVFVHFTNSHISIYCQKFNDGDKYSSGSMISFHTTYLTTI
ncbi:hypothetical protein [Limosilactobacillus vaginalis]|uniref:hypothetical protein n=1 Tax=Limosilactobacillus vaginalis TaxID=1633 RepID=UPI003AAD40B0